MSKVVAFLGAGASKASEGPLTSEILPKILKMKDTPDPASSPGTSARLTLLETFLCDLFHVTSGSPDEQYPSLPLVMSLLDTALDRRQSFHPDWDAARIREVREAMELGIFDLLEQRLNKAPTNAHYGLINTMYPGPDEPRIITTNYDLIVDTAMMFASESRFPEGRFPDYRCQIRTNFYVSEPARFGTLLKLHGSLNWLYCRTCHRLEIGASESKLYIKVLTRMIGTPSLEQYYAIDGGPCPTCATKLRPLLIAPTHLKDYRNPHLSQVWYEAECLLREAEEVVFIGYGLPDDDVEVIYLLKRCLAHVPAPKITVVEWDPSLRSVDSNPVGRRYRTLFGDGLNWHPEGMVSWIAQRQASATRA